MRENRSPVPVEDLLKHTGWIRALAASVLRDDDLAEDVVQDMRLAALRRPPRKKYAVRRWMRRVVRNLTFAHVRDKQRRKAIENLVAKRDEEVSPEQLRMRAELLREVTDVVLALPEPLCSTVLLRYYCDKDSGEIARIQGVPSATVRVRLLRARGKLRETLARKYGEEWGDWRSAIIAILQPLRPGATSVPGAGILGAFVMSAKLKIGLGTVLLVALVGWWTIDQLRHREKESPEPPGGGSAATPTYSTQKPKDPGARIATAPFRASEERRGVSSATRKAFGSLTVHVSWEEDGSPAADRAVHIRQREHPQRHWARRHARTDNQGNVHLGQLHPGQVFVCTDLGAYTTTEVQRGVENEVDLKIPVGATVDVQVVDDVGRDVPRAEVWLTDDGYSDRPLLLGICDEKGRYRVRSITGQRWISARSPLHAPSASWQILAREQRNLTLKIALPGQGGNLKGRVIGKGGPPVAGAVVKFWPTIDRTLIPPRGKPPARICVATDDQGRFRADGLPLGVVFMSVRGRGWSGAEEVTATILPGQTAEAVIELEKGAALIGIVRDHEGLAVPGATVMIGLLDSNNFSMTKSLADGSFRLECSSGRQDVVAARRGVGKAEKQFEFDPGLEHRWDPVLDPGRYVKGVVLDDQNHPLAAHLVNAVVMSGRPWKGATTTDSRGRFMLTECPNSPLRLKVVDRRSKPWTTLAVVDDIQPGTSDLVIVANESARPSSFFVGRLVGPRGQPFAARIRTIPTVDLRTGMIRKNARDVKGDFRLGPYAAGEYRVAVGLSPLGTMALGNHKLLKDKITNLGEITVPASGLLHLDLDADSDVLAQLRIEIRVESKRMSYGRNSLTLVAADVKSPLSVPPGIYEIRLTGPHTVAKSQEVEIQSSQETSVRLNPKWGTPVMLVFAHPPEKRPWPVEYEIRESNDVTSDSGRATIPDTEGRLRKRILLVPGNYIIEARNSREGTGSKVFGVPRTRDLQRIEVFVDG